MAALTLTLTDLAGVTDTGQAAAFVGQLTDRAGITDKGQVQGLDGVTTDDSGLTDSGSSRSVAEVLTDPVGLVDVPIRSGTVGSGTTYVLTFSDRALAQGANDLITLEGGSPPTVPLPPGTVIATGLPAVIVEVAFDLPQVGATAFVLDDPVNGLLDSGFTLTPGLLWTDISHWVQTFSTNRSSQRVAGPVTRYEAGTLELELLNDDRRFDPTNNLGPYINSLGVTQVRPMRPIRVRANWKGQLYPLFSGYVDSWMDEGVSPVHSVTQVSATDGFKIIANDRGEPTTVVGVGERTDQRIHRILNGVGWPNGARDIAQGDIAIQGTTLSGDALSELQLVADTEAGDLYISPEGVVTFRNRRSYSTEPASAESQATFGRFDREGELPYSDVGREYDDSTLINQALITREGGTEQAVIDDASVSEYQLHSYARQDLLFTNDADALVYAKFLVSANSAPEYRFNSLTLDPRADPLNLFPQALGRRIGDRITVIRRPPGTGYLDSGVSSRHSGSPAGAYFTVVAADADKWNEGDRAQVWLASDSATLTDALFIVQGVSTAFAGFVNVFVDRAIIGITDGMIVHLMAEDRIERAVFVRGIQHTLDENHRWTTTFTLQGAASYQGGGGQAAYLVLDTANGYLDLNLLAPSTPPTGSTLVVQTVPGTKQVNVVWTLSGATAASYVVQRDGVDSTGASGTPITQPPTSTHYLFTTLLSGTAYTFTVVATLIDGSQLTTTATATPS